MIEIGIGVLFAVLFVTAYLIVSRLLRTGEHGQPRWRELSSHPFGGSKHVGTKPARLFLATGEMSEHHARAKGTQGR